MSIMDTILDEIEAYLKATGMKPSAFGREAMKNPSFVFRLRGRRNYTSASVEKARAYMASHPAPRKTG